MATRNSNEHRYEYQYGRVLDKSGNYSEALKWYRIAARKGSVLSKNNIGVFYSNGFSVDQNKQTALVWFKEAADQGLKIAQTNYDRTLTEINDINQSDNKKSLTSDIVLSALELVSPNADEIYANAIDSWSETTWLIGEAASTAVAGMAATIVPGAHIPAMAVDLAYLLRKMATSSLGIGAIKGHNLSCGNIVDAVDFVLILGAWADSDSYEEVYQEFSNKMQVFKAQSLGKKRGMNMMMRLVQKKGLLIGKKLGLKSAAKIAAKFSGKLAAKFGAGFVPVAGAIIGGGINAYFVYDISGAADRYYSVKSLVCHL